MIDIFADVCAPQYVALGLGGGDLGAVRDEVTERLFAEFDTTLRNWAENKDTGKTSKLVGFR